MTARNWAPLRRFLDPMRPLTYGIVQAGPHVENGIPYIRPTDMSATEGVLAEESLPRTTFEIARSYARAALQAGDVVMSIGPSFGKVMVTPNTLAGANLTQGTARLACGPQILPRYLYWWLQSEHSKQHWDAVTAGATFSALNLGPLGETPVLCPPLDTQRLVADLLDDQVSRIDEAVRLRREQIEAVSKRFASHLDRAVARLFTDFPASPLRRDLVLIEQGYSPVCDAQSAGTGEFGVLKTNAVRRGVFRADQNKHLPDESLVDGRYVIENGDILITRGSGSRDLVADLAVVSGLTPSSPTLLLSDLLYRLRFRSLNADFVAAVLLSPRLRSEVAASTRGAAGGTIKVRGEDLANLVIPVPPRAVQDEFALANAQRTNDRERVVAEMAAQVSLLEERKRSLITAAVTGEFDATTASGREI